MPELTLTGFTKVNEAKDPELLEATELQALYNMVLDKKAGKPVKRGGLTPFSSGDYSAYKDIVAMHDVVDSGGTNYLLTTSSTKLQKVASGGTGAYSDVKTGLSEASLDVGYKTRITSIRPGEYVVTNGVDVPFLIKASGFSYNTSLYITAPDVSSVATTPDTGGSMDPGFYRYILIYVDNYEQYSLPSIPIFSIEDYSVGGKATTLPSGNNRLNFASLPTNAAMKTRWLFRTTQMGSTYYFLADLGPTETTYVDNMKDSDLITSGITLTYITQPKFKYLTSHKQRVFGGNVLFSTSADFIATKLPRYSGKITGMTVSGGSGLGSLTMTATYKYRVYMAALDGTLGDYKELTLVLAPGQDEGHLGDLPFFDTGTYNLIIYRTKGDGSTFYKLKTITTVSYTYADFAADTTLTEQLPAAAAFNYSSAVVFTEIAKSSNFYAEYILQIFPDSADEITGVFDDGDGVIVFKRNIIAKIYTSGAPEGWRVAKLMENLGCTEPNTLVKNNSEYFFISNKRAFIVNTAGGVKNVGEIFKTSLEAVTTWHDVAYNPQKQWYILAVSVSSTYYLYVYDTKIDTWYRFTVPSGDTKAVLTKIYGSDTGTILAASDGYIQKYNESSTTDSKYPSSGTPLQITSELRTKTFTINDGIGEIRLRRLWTNYKKASSQQTDLYIYNGDASSNRAFYDSTGSGIKTLKLITDAMMDGSALKTASKVQFKITGAGLDEWYNMKFEFIPIRRGTRSLGN